MIRLMRAMMLAGLLLAALGLAGQAAPSPVNSGGGGATTRPVCRVLIISGDPGTEPNAAIRFAGWTQRWAALLKDTYGYRPENIRVLRSPAKPVVFDARAAGADNAPPPQPVFPKELLDIPAADLASHQNVMGALADLVRLSNEGDQVLLVLVGHGYETHDAGKFCLPGADLSDVEAGQALSKLRAQHLICLNTAPASATWAKALAGPRRIVITATMAPGMGNQTYFGEFLIRALQPGKVTLLQAFNTAAHDTIRWYQNQFAKQGGVVVHGKDFQDVYRLMYPGQPMEAGDDKPQEPNNNPADMQSWLGRRVLTELAGLDDQGTGKPAGVYEDAQTIKPLPNKDGQGTLAAKIILGAP